MGRVTQRFPADRDVIGVNLLAIVAYQGLGYAAWATVLGTPASCSSVVAVLRRL